MANQTHDKGRGASPAKAGALPKTATYIAGLDEVLEGGLPVGRTTLVNGGPGCGKSVLGLEFVYRGAAAGEPGIFITFEERADAVRANASTLGMDLAPLEEAGKIFLYAAHVDPEMVLAGEFDLKGLLAIIEGKAKAMGARRIVLDALDVLLRLYDNPARERTELYAINEWLRDHEMTAVLTVKTPQVPVTPSRYEFLDFMADCVIYLDQRTVEQVTTRRLHVVKYQGSSHGRNEYPFVITADGINVIRLSTSGLKHKPLGEKMSSGQARLDTILNGGYRRASCILISGTTGAGKTALAATFVRAACERGERVLYISFEESEEVLVDCLLSPGIDLRPALQAGTLQFMTAMPEAVGAEEHLVRAFKAMEAFEPHHVIVDAISSCQRIGTEHAAFEYAMRLLNACKEQGITTIFTNQTTGFQNVTEISGIGVSSVVDTLIFLRFIEVGGEINRLLLVAKSRGTKHSNQYREFLITDDGIDIMDVYPGEGGALTGAARQEQEAKEAIKRRLRQAGIERQEAEVARRRAMMEAEAARLQAEVETAEIELEHLRLEQRLVEAGRDARGKMRGEDTNSDRLVGRNDEGEGGAE